MATSTSKTGENSKDDSKDDRQYDIKGKYNLALYKKEETKINFSQKQGLRSKILLKEESGFLRTNADNKKTFHVTQQQIVDSVDVTSATKYFNLDLQFGPYRVDYTKNGRYLLMGGRKGHLAVIDWVTKHLLCETGVMESVHDVAWLHNETLFAAAQKQNLFIYDNQAVEVHSIKKLQYIKRMEFLPNHFLLACAREYKTLSWVDVSMGELVSNIKAEEQHTDAVCQNPANAILVVGHGSGAVSMWSPTENKPAVTMLCLPCPITAVAIDKTGRYMATAGANSMLKVWDLRHNYRPLHERRMFRPSSNLSISQRNKVAVGLGEQVLVYEKIDDGFDNLYMRHSFRNNVSCLRFCPYEDALGVGTEKGVSSLIIPGAGEANYDAMEANPFETKSQRRETEIKNLLNKIPAELISINEGQVNEVDLPGLEEMIEKQQEENPLRKIEMPTVKLRNKTRQKSTTVNLFKRKKKVVGKIRGEKVEEIKKLDKKFRGKAKEPEQPKPYDPLDRFGAM